MNNKFEYYIKSKNYRNINKQVTTLSPHWFMPPIEAYMLSSVVLDLKVSQVVDVPNWIATAYFPLDVIENKSVKDELRELINSSK
ncbi:hypothetical protein DDW09_02980 [Sulfolobus sp. SCGC AB-777_L09]|nr:hypothetical protein DDW09_02980 [Sulfolobus sp. SCGC AB-777_L09]